MSFVASNYPVSSGTFFAARDKAVAELLAARNAQGHWAGELSSSALATATAVCALAIFSRDACVGRAEIRMLMERGLDWLVANQNPDGGWGDTDRSYSNISTTTLVWAALGTALKADRKFRVVVEGTERWLRQHAGGVEAERLSKAIAARYGKDRTFSIPILTMCALAGRLGTEAEAWRFVPQLPFELAVLPANWFGALRFPVVSYALPALIAIGQVRHHFRPTRNPITRMLRYAARERTLKVLSSIQPPNGGFLEAVPLTSFVTMSLAGMGLTEHPVTVRGIEFLVKSARSDGSWAIDSNLSTWVTTLSVNALLTGSHGAEGGGAGWKPTSQMGADGVLTAEEKLKIRDWLVGQQHRELHPYTQAAPGGWAWTDLPGGVPDADDTAGALLALHRLGTPDDITRDAACAGINWLMGLQNRDGGIPTFCKGWGALPFDRSSPDLTAHALGAWATWLDQLPDSQQVRVRKAIDRALEYLAVTQRDDGSWVPLWFGHQDSSNDENPLYGTARVLSALQPLVGCGAWPNAAMLATRATDWLVNTQKPDGGWSGAPVAPSSVEETALAVEALATQRGALFKCPAAVENRRSRSIARGAAWLVAKVESGEWREPSPIGFYFAKLWYYERLYPLIFTAGALRGAERELKIMNEEG